VAEPSSCQGDECSVRFDTRWAALTRQPPSHPPLSLEKTLGTDPQQEPPIVGDGYSRPRKPPDLRSTQPAVILTDRLDRSAGQVRPDRPFTVAQNAWPAGGERPRIRRSVPSRVRRRPHPLSRRSRPGHRQPRLATIARREQGAGGNDDGPEGRPSSSASTVAQLSGPYAGPKLGRSPRTGAHPVDSAPESVQVSGLERTTGTTRWSLLSGRPQVRVLSRAPSGRPWRDPSTRDPERWEAAREVVGRDLKQLDLVR
jgi:hypothetical protein